MLGSRTLHPSLVTSHEVLDHQPVPERPHVKIWDRLHSQERESGTRVISSLQLLQVRSGPSQAATQGLQPLPQVLTQRGNPQESPLSRKAT